MSHKKYWTFKQTVPPVMNGQALKTLLSDYWQLPKHLVYSIRHAERVLVNGEYLPVNFPVNAGDQIQLTFTPADFANPFPHVQPDSAASVEIVYEDANLLVVNKHRGDKTHPNQPGEIGATINHLAAYLQTKETVPYIIHRLDQQTSGAILFAKKIPWWCLSWSRTSAKRRLSGRIWHGWKEPGFHPKELLISRSAVIPTINESEKLVVQVVLGRSPTITSSNNWAITQWSKFS